MRKKVLVRLMLLIIFALVSSCSKEQYSDFKLNHIDAGYVSWVTPSSVLIKNGANVSEVWLTSEKYLLEDIEKAYEKILNPYDYTVLSQSYYDYDNLDIDGFLFLGLKPSTTYYYVSLIYNYRDGTYTYGDIGSFTTDEEITETVDLGLSVKWRGWNLGAESAYNIGDKYMWGYTTSGYDYDPQYPHETNIVGTEYDAARVKLGKDWRMPTKEECDELRERCTFQKVIFYDETIGSSIDGVYITGPSGKHILIPHEWKLWVNDFLYTCCFWIGESGISNGVNRYYFSSYGGGCISTCDKNWDLPIRAVRE